MQIIFKKSFLKQYKKLKKYERVKVDHALKIFEGNPFDPKLRNHALIGKLSGLRSISAAFDLRIVFAVEGNYVTVIMLGVGSHNQVY